MTLFAIAGKKIAAAATDGASEEAAAANSECVAPAVVVSDAANRRILQTHRSCRSSGDGGRGRGQNRSSRRPIVMRCRRRGDERGDTSKGAADRHVLLLEEQRWRDDTARVGTHMLMTDSAVAVVAAKRGCELPREAKAVSMVLNALHYMCRPT